MRRVCLAVVVLGVLACRAATPPIPGEPLTTAPLTSVPELQVPEPWAERHLLRVVPAAAALRAWLPLDSETPGTAASPSRVAGTLTSAWLFPPASRVPLVYLSVRWDPNLGTLDLRGFRVRFGREGLGFRVERGLEDRDARFLLEFGRGF